MLYHVNPIWTGLFADLKRLGGGAKWPPPNVAISTQMIMKLGNDILWVDYKLTKNFDDVIVTLIL